MTYIANGKIKALLDGVGVNHRFKASGMESFKGF